MKRSCVLLVAAALVMGITACGGSSSGGSNVAESVQTETLAESQTETEKPQETAAETAAEQTEPETVVVPERDLPEGDYEEIGEGSFYITSPSGSTENGDEIILYPEMNTWPHADIGIEFWDMDGSVQTFLYVDGIEMDKHQVGAGYQGSISFDDDSLWAITSGDHKVEAVQYADNDPAGEMTFYRSAVYTVKGDAVESRSESSSQGTGVKVEEHLLSVEITVPGSFFADEENDGATQEHLDELKAENGDAISYTLNDDGSVTCKMSKDQQKKMLDEFKQNILDSFDECRDPEKTDMPATSFQEISFNDDVSEITITVDPETYAEFDAFYALGFEYMGIYYQIFSGVPEEDAHVFVYFADPDGNVIETADSDALFNTDSE